MSLKSQSSSGRLPKQSSNPNTTTRHRYSGLQMALIPSTSASNARQQHLQQQLCVYESIKTQNSRLPEPKEESFTLNPSPPSWLYRLSLLPLISLSLILIFLLFSSAYLIFTDLRSENFHIHGIPPTISWGHYFINYFPRFLLHAIFFLSIASLLGTWWLYRRIRYAHLVVDGRRLANQIRLRLKKYKQKTSFEESIIVGKLEEELIGLNSPLESYKRRAWILACEEVSRDWRVLQHDEGGRDTGSPSHEKKNQAFAWSWLADVPLQETSLAPLEHLNWANN